MALAEQEQEQMATVLAQVAGLVEAAQLLVVAAELAEAAGLVELAAQLVVAEQEVVEILEEGAGAGADLEELHRLGHMGTLVQEVSHYPHLYRYLRPRDCDSQRRWPRKARRDD